MFFSKFHLPPICLFIWPCGVAYEILVPWLGTEPVPSAGDVWSPNHRTAREVPISIFNFVRGFIWCLVTSGSQFIFGSRRPKLWKWCTCEYITRVLTIDFTVGWAVWTICIGGFPNVSIFRCFSCLSVYLYECMCGAKSLHSCPTLCDPMDCSALGCSVHSILQARILEWVAISLSRESSWPRDQTVSFMSPALAAGFFTTIYIWICTCICVHTIYVCVCVCVCVLLIERTKKETK